MKAIILAAGVGKRIKEITDNKPKCFLEIKGLPIIQHQINIFKNAGIHDIMIIIGYKKEYFKKLKDKNLNFLYNPFFNTTNVLGSFWFAKDHLTEPFVFVHADTYFEPEILNRLLKTKGDAFAVEFKSCGAEEMKVKVKNGYITDISKNMNNSDGEFIGIAKIENFSRIKETLENLIEDNYNSFFERVIEGLIKSNMKFKAVDITDLIWEEIDFKEDYENLISKIKR